MEKAIEIKRRAQRCVQNGDLDGALREYEKLVETPESDPYNFVLLADLLYKKGEQGRAAERYLAGVTAYEKAGLYKNAIAVCKKMTRLSLSQAVVLRHLAELHALDGLTSEASVYFSQYADHMTRSNNATEAAIALRKAFDNGQENVRLLEQLSEVLLLEGEDQKAAEALREAAGHWRTRGHEPDARRCTDRANKLDPAGAGASASEPEAQAGPPRLTLPSAAAPAVGHAPKPKQAPKPAHGPADAGAAPARAAAQEPTARFDFTKDLPLVSSAPPADPLPPVNVEPGPATHLANTPPPPPADSGVFERPRRFVAPGTTPAPAAVTPPEPEPEPDPDPSPSPDGGDDEVAADQEGVYEIGSADATNYESAVNAVGAEVQEDAPAGSQAAPSASGTVDGVALVEHLLQQAQEEFRAGDREKASRALVEAAVTYEKLGRLDSAATIFRSLGRGAQSPLEVMELWLANCERRGDHAEGSQVACELGDRALNDGQEAQARTWFEHAVGIDPSNETARRRLQRMNGPASGAGPLVPPAPPATPGAPIEAGRVEVALGRGQAVTFDLAGLLQEFQRGVESQLEGDAQGHYDLGMAYREMGLHDQAIESFRIAERDARLAGRAYEMVGRCHADSGAHDEAVAAFRVALERTALDGAGEAELRYQLALSMAAAGDLAGAVRELELADARYPGRPDVAERMSEWRRAFGKAA